MINNVYDIAVFLLGELPQQFQFAYIILALVISLVFIICIFSPFIIAIKWFK